MATPRSRIVDENVTPWYHCVSRCVRAAFLCGEEFPHRKVGIETRLRELVGLFSIDCAGYAVMDNHLHLLLRLDSARAQAWSDVEVARRWATLFPIRDMFGTPLPVTETRARKLAEDVEWVAKVRKRLSDLGWFMKCLKEPIARQANKEDGHTGAFWEGRYKSVAVLDVESILATAAYIDLNPVAAGTSPTPEESKHTSFRTRLDHCRDNGTLETLGDDLSTQTHNPAQEIGLWLMPVDDSRQHGSDRPGLVEGLTLSCYVRLLDWTSRLVREGKGSVDADACSLFARLGLESSSWEATISQLFKEGKRTGGHFGSPARLAEVAQIHGRRRHRNLFRRTATARPAA